MNRRRFFGLMAAAPIAAKATAQSAAADLAKIQVNGLGQYGAISGGYSVGGLSPSPDYGIDPRSLLKKALLDPSKRAEIESLMFERHRGVGAIDADLACYRTFSLNAKIAFQRQRNVRLALQEEVGESGWQRWHESFHKLTGWLS
jgi:opacity protein-like surface antigen